MIFGLFRKTTNEAVIDRLYETVVSASRVPVLYTDLGVPDTFEGRFESLTLHAALVLRRLQRAETPGPAMAQHLIDTVFRHFDRTLREMGVGDTTVPKRMKTMAEAFLGRSSAYEQALKDPDDSLAATLARNVYAGQGDGEALAAYVRTNAERIADLPLQDFIDGRIAFAAPASSGLVS